MKVDPERYVSGFEHYSSARCGERLLTLLQTVEADGELMTAEPSTELPLAQTYFVY